MEKGQPGTASSSVRRVGAGQMEGSNMQSFSSENHEFYVLFPDGDFRTLIQNLAFLQ